MINKGIYINKTVLFSIITVCYNAEKNIEKTINSVLNQTNTDYEYIVIDGKSTDNTLSTINSYKKSFEDKGISFKVVSEKDNGIYDAMNKGIDLCKGKWVNFMNAGDRFYDSNTLEKVSPYCEDNKYDLVFGDTINKNGKLYQYCKCREFDREMSFCHQSAFTKSKYLKQLHFNDKYTLSADNHFYVRMAKQSVNACRLQFPIAIYSVDGVSTKNMTTVYRENALIRLNEGIWNEKQYQERIEEIKKIESNSFIEEHNESIDIRKQRIKNIIPPFILDFRKRYYINKRRKREGWVKKCP